MNLEQGTHVWFNVLTTLSNNSDYNCCVLISRAFHVAWLSWLPNIGKYHKKIRQEGVCKPSHKGFKKLLVLLEDVRVAKLHSLSNT
jgi:hypothetical protein